MENKWNHSWSEGIATNPDPEFGGIVDKAIVSQKWFAVSNHILIETREGFETKQEAIDYLTSEATRIAMQSQSPEYKS